MTLLTHPPLATPLVVGKFGAAYGIRGWLKLFSITEQPEQIFAYRPWYIKQGTQWQQVVVEDWKYHNQDLVIKLQNYDDRQLVSVLTNLEIFVEADNLPALAQGEYYWKDLIGCQVVTVAGYQLGTVSSLMETGSNDVLVVKANLRDAYGMKERLLPFLDPQVIKQVDISAKQIIVDWDPAF